MTDALLNAYQAVEALSGHMLQAAERADWPAFAQASQACTRQVEALRARSAGRTGVTPLSPAQAAQKQAILLKILRHDAQIRRLRAGLSIGPSNDHLSEPSATPRAVSGFSAYPLPPAGGLLH